MESKQFKRIMLEIVIGIILSMILCAIWIGFGYYTIKTKNINEYIVRFFGIQIYAIKKVGSSYEGVANNQNMIFLGVIVSMLLMIITETRYYWKGQKVEK